MRACRRDGWCRRATISASADYGYLPKAGRRKVLLWSRSPWIHVDDLGAESLPSGRSLSQERPKRRLALSASSAFASHGTERTSPPGGKIDDHGRTTMRISKDRQECLHSSTKPFLRT